VNQAGLDRLGELGAEPTKPELDRGQRLADRIELALPLLDLGKRGIDHWLRQDTVECAGIDRVDSRQGLGELVSEPPSGGLVLGLAKDARGDRGARDLGHQHAGGLEPATVRLEGNRLGHRGPGVGRDADQRKLVADRHQ
jgi:hypothetical protein